MYAYIVANVFAPVMCVYGNPIPNTYQGDKLSTLVNASKIANVPMYIGEWNEVSREEKIYENGNFMFQIDPAKSNLTQIKADNLIKEFKRWTLGGWRFAIGTTF